VEEVVWPVTQTSVKMGMVVERRNDKDAGRFENSNIQELYTLSDDRKPKQKKDCLFRKHRSIVWSILPN
jgi:hypothetical protein